MTVLLQLLLLLLAPRSTQLLGVFKPPPEHIPRTGAVEHWARVDIAPVPAFDIDTHDPVTEDIYISAAAHDNAKWDPYIWDRIVAIWKEEEDMGAAGGGSGGKGLCFIDVGANVGFFSLMAASLGFHVIAFEPMPRNAQRLARSIRRNSAGGGFDPGQIVLYRNAVSDIHGQRVALRETDAHNYGNGQVQSGRVPAESGVEYAETVTLNSVLLFSSSATTTPAVDATIVKIDVEGLETNVLAGAREWICSRRVQHVMIEFSDATRANRGAPATDMFMFMRRAGYTVSDVSVSKKAGEDGLDYNRLVAGDFAGVPNNLLFSLSGPRATCDDV